MFIYFFLKKRIKRLKSGGKSFLINLAIADLFKCTFAAPFNIYNNLYGEWRLGQIGNQIFYAFFRVNIF